MFPHPDKLVAVFVCSSFWSAFVFHRRMKVIRCFGSLWEVAHDFWGNFPSNHNYRPDETRIKGLIFSPVNFFKTFWRPASNFPDISRFSMTEGFLRTQHGLSCFSFWSTLNSSKLYCFLSECVCDWTEVLCLPLVAHLVTAQTDLLI